MRKISNFLSYSSLNGGAYALIWLLTVVALMACLPQEATAAWSTVALDGGYLEDTSIGVDSNGYVHMSFVKDGCLFYTNNKNAKWIKNHEELRCYTRNISKIIHLF